MPGWKFVLDEQAFDFFRAAHGAERQALIRAFEELRTHPTGEGDWQSRDAHGRDVEVGVFGKFLIYFGVTTPMHPSEAIIWPLTSFRSANRR